MAASSLFQEGQNVMACQLCEETNEIKWKCMTCEFLMCTRCCKIHRKVKSTWDHDIVDIKYITIQTTKSTIKKEFTKLKCRHHGGQTCCLFCQDCKEVVCSLCIASTHNKLNMGEISEEYTFLVQRLNEMNLELGQECRDLEHHALTLETARSSEKDKYAIRKQDILHQDKALKDAVEQHTRKLLADFDENWDRVDKSITSEESKISQRTKDIEEKKSSIQEVIVSENVETVFNLAKKDVVKDDQKPVSIKEKLPSFVPGEITLAKMESLYGNLSNGAKENVQDELKLSVEETRGIFYPRVENILPGVDGSLWINNYDSKLLQNISVESGTVYINKTYTIKVLSMSCAPNGDLILSTGKNALRVIPKSTGEISVTKFCVGPDQCTCGVHVTRDYKVLIGVHLSATDFPPEGEGQVQVMNMDGIMERIYMVDDEPLFTDPCKIRTDSQNNVHILDTISDDMRGRIVTLNECGSVRGIYTGHLVMNKDISFYPEDFVVTKSDNLIVTDSENSALHLLNSEGQCIAYKNTHDIGIEYPYSLGIDNRGRLLIGTVGSSESTLSKIYTVCFSL